MYTLAAAVPSGVLLSLLTALCWAASPICFASAGRRIGAFRVLLLRSLLAALLLLAILPIYVIAVEVPISWPSTPQTGWLILSAFFGMALGDALIYEALVTLGPRRSTQILTLAPVGAVALGWLLLGERLELQTVSGTTLVIAATFYAVLARPAPGSAAEPGRASFSGTLLAAAGALCVGVGAVTGRQAFTSGPPLDATVATLVRVGSCAVMLWVIPLARGDALATLSTLRDRFVAARVSAGVLVGPFAGMLCYLFALQRLEAGLVSTLVAMSPLFILPMMALRYRLRVGPNIVLAALLATLGVALISLR